MHCAGFPSDTYDRYVLGLLEEPDRSQLETQIQEQCPACISGVQRSMNLWLVFAETLEKAEPSEDFRGRIVRIAELSRKVLTFPKNSAVQERSSVSVSTLLAVCGITAVLLVATWYAGRSSSRLDTQSGNADLDRLAQEKAQVEVKLLEETDRRSKVESELGSSGKTALAQVQKLQDQLTQAQASASECQGVVQLDKQRLADSTKLLTMLHNAGARLWPMKAAESAGKAIGYTILQENSELLFLGANLPTLHEGRAYQLWLIRKEDPKLISAGMINIAKSGEAIATFEEKALLTGVTGIQVTEEPTQGSDAPTGTKLLEASTVEEN